MLLLLVATVAGAFLVSYFHHRSPLVISHSTPARRAVIFVLSGVPASALAGTNLPNISALRRRGTDYRNGWVGQMEDVPLASAATIGTGAFPRSTGIIGAEWRDPSSGALVNPTTFLAMQQGELDQIMQAAGPPSLAQTVVGANSRATSLSIGGEDCAVPNVAGTWMATYVLCPRLAGQFWVPAAVTGHAPPRSVLAAQGLRTPASRGSTLAASLEGWPAGAQDSWIAHFAVRAIRMMNPTLTVVTFPEYNTLARYAPPARTRLLRFVLHGIDRNIGAIVAELRREHRERQTVYVVTSDGGITIPRHYIPIARLARAVRSAGGRLLYYAAGNSLVMGLQSPGQAQPVAQAIQAARIPGIDAIYYRARSHGSYHYALEYVNPARASSYPTTTGYLLRTMASATAPDVVVAFAPGLEVRGLPAGTRLSTGSSLGMGRAEQRIPFIVAGHGVQGHRTSTVAARLVDIAPTVAALLGKRLDGSPGMVLEDAFQHQRPDLLVRERSMARTLQRYAAALR